MMKPSALSSSTWACAAATPADPHRDGGNGRDPAVLMSSAEVDRMRRYVESGFPEECCGVLIGVREASLVRISDVVCAANIAEGDRRRRYQVAWEALFTAYRQAEAAGRTVIGVFHSHPDGTDSPSDIDTREALDDFLYIIVPVREGVAGLPRAWRFADGGFVPGDLVIEGV